MSVDSHTTQAATPQQTAISGSSANGRVLVAEDDDEMRSLIALALKQDGYRIGECRNGVELLSQLQRRGERNRDAVSLVISDVRMPGASGLAILEGLSRQPEAPPVILITAFGDSETHTETRRLGAVACLDKPFDMEDLMGHVHNIVPRAGPD